MGLLCAVVPQQQRRSCMAAQPGSWVARLTISLTAAAAPQQAAVSRMAVEVDTSSRRPSASYSLLMPSSMSAWGLHRVLTRTPLHRGGA